MKRNYMLLAVVLVAFIVMKSCKNDSSNDEQLNVLTSFKAVEMPSKLANGDPFPLDSTVINNWLSRPNVDMEGVQNNPNVIGHSWGLWQALTEVTDIEYNGRRLRRYETWYTPQDVIQATESGSSLSDLKRTDGHLQFRTKFGLGHDSELNTSAGDISGKVKYNPSMAQRALDQNYFDVDYIKSLAKPGEINSVAFKSSDVMLKPVYRVLTDKNQVGEDTYYFNIWAGKIDGGKADTIPSGDGEVFSKVIKVTTDINKPMKEMVNDTMVYNIKNFIYHNMNAQEALRYNEQSKEGQEFVDDTAEAGDAVILLGMHVSTRETRKWTWQSFYWTETPDNPVFPSSSTVAEGRKNLNPELDFAANQYAVSIAYSMMSPALPFDTPNGDPIDLRNGDHKSVYGLNPYIEGTFTKEVFPKQDSLFTQIKPEYAMQYVRTNDVGIKSNCMSCHSMSYWSPKNDNIGTAVSNFMADQYINRNAPWFENSVQLDFAWSLYPGFEQSLLDLEKAYAKKLKKEKEAK